MTADLGTLADFAYQTLGIDPITWATGHVVRSQLELHQAVKAARKMNPASYPEWPPDMSTDALACRIVGAMIGAGWTPPEVTK